MVTLITRAQWGARPPTRPLTQVPWSRRVGVAVHYTQGNRDDTPLELQIYAQDVKGYADGHYNLLVDYLGRAYEGRGWTVSAAHSEGENFEWIGIAFIGRDSDVTPAAEATITALIADADVLAGRRLQLAGHQELPGAQTSCPGQRLMALVRGLRDGGDEMSWQTVLPGKDLDGHPQAYTAAEILHGCNAAAWTAVRLLERMAPQLGIDPEELAAIREAARAGAEAGVVQGADELAAALAPLLNLDVAAVKAAMAEVLGRTGFTVADPQA